ncbi:hypothetical protein Tco_1006342 [Tanacetum coccineum]|uniref:Uncharacterized protein n=1 Tax=Tanacetum coccineum TaxID=301880 RepID=A0ABQ5FIJ9_9ASTR
MNDLRNCEQLAQDLARENNNESSSGEEEEAEQHTGGDDDYSDEDERPPGGESLVAPFLPDIMENKIELVNTVLSCLGYEDDDDFLLYYQIPLKSLDIGLKPLVSDSDISNLLGFVNKHKMMYVYVEQVEKTESYSDKDGEGDSESEDANDFVDEEYLVDEVEVNMSSFKFQIDGEDDTGFIDHIQPHVNVTEDDLEVLDFDSLENDQDDVPENSRSRGLRN